MRSSTLAAAIIVAGVLPSLAQQPGDRVVVIAERTKLRGETNLSVAVTRGAVLRVNEAQGDSLRVMWQDGADSVKKGWISRTHTMHADKALEFFNGEISRAPTAENYNARGIAFYETKNYEAAIKDFGEAIRTNPGMADAWSNRGRTWEVMEQYDRALADLNEAIALNPNVAVAFNRRGAVWIKKSDYTRAIEDFDEALRLDPQFTPSYLNRGGVWLVQRDAVKANADFCTAIQLDPMEPAAHSARAKLRVAVGELDTALSDINEAVRLNPRDSDSLYTRAVIWNEKGKYQEAIRDHEEAIRLNPETGANHFYLARILAICPDRKFRDGKRAVQLATSCCDRDKWKSCGSLQLLASACAETHDFSNAVKWQRQALEFASEAEKRDCRYRLIIYESAQTAN